MKRSVEWYADHKARMARQWNGNAELVQVTRIGKAVAHVPVKLSGERYPNLLIMLHEQGVPAPVTEYPFAGNRRWRFDYAWPYHGAKIALEVDGGAWTQGRHTRGQGFIEDQDKRNAAVMLGWKVIHTTPDRLEDAVRCVRLLMSGAAA